MTYSNDIYVQEVEAQLKLVYSTSLTPSSMLCSYYRDKTNNLLKEFHNNNIQLLLFSTSIHYTKNFLQEDQQKSLLSTSRF